MSEIRYNLLRDEYVLVAPERLTRPTLFGDSKKLTQDIVECPFCVGNEKMTPKEICSLKDSNGKWLTRVVPNLYKAVAIELECASKEDGLYQKMGGFGAHEVIIDAPFHQEHFENLNQKQMALWLKTLKCRVDDLRRDTRLIYFSIFKNQGENSGSTIPHIHTQLIALPFVPKNEIRVLKHLFYYFKEHGRGVIEDMVDFEIDDKKRVVKESKNFLAIAPYGSCFAFETLILPKIKAITISELDDELIDELSVLLKSLLLALKKAIGEFDYNLYINHPPFHKNFENEEFFNDIGEFYRFYISIIPRLYKTGGFELQSSTYINPMLPEEAAKIVRDSCE